MAENVFQKFYRKEIKKIQRRFIKNTGSYSFVVPAEIVGSEKDLQKYFESINSSRRKSKKILVIYYNHLWEPILKLASSLGLRKHVGNQNWLDENDLRGILDLSGYEVVSTEKRILLPVEIPFLTFIINNVIANIPFFNSFCLMTTMVARTKQVTAREYSVSIIIPARNEEKNISRIIPSIPKFSKKLEYIFIEGHSNDNTWEEIKKVAQRYRNVKFYKQKGEGKADAVRLGLSTASNEILMIYDADRTVDGGDLPKFYKALASGIGEFANGSRLIYPMEDQAMQTLNKVGNKIFSVIFSWILGQRFKDTLCGTKVFFRDDYLKFKHSKRDPFGDFDLIFGAIRQNLKVVEIPVRYKERQYGTTNIRRFYHGLMLCRTVISAFVEFKTW